jgi:hypothetical protein
MAVIKSLEKIYMLKSVGIPEFYLGGNVELLGYSWKNQGLELALSAKTYIQSVIPKFEGLFGKELKPIKTPMSEGYYPEVDDSPLCTGDDSAKYRSIIGCCIWIIVLGRFDIAYVTSAMSRFNLLPGEGYLKSLRESCPISRHFQRGELSLTLHILTILCTLLKIIQIGWNSTQMLVNRFSPEKRPRVRMTVYVDADHAHDLVTRRSITGILVLLNNY